MMHSVQFLQECFLSCPSKTFKIVLNHCYLLCHLQVYAEFLMNLAKLGQSFKKDNCSLEPLFI